MSPPRTLAGRALLAPSPIPEPGAWWRVDGEVDGRRLWARTPDDDVVEADGQAVSLAAERLRHLDHPGIPSVVSVDPEAGTLVVAAPEGVPLARLLEHRHEEAFRMTPATVLDLGVKLTDAIVHAHERGRPHGHLSPDAVWLTEAGEVVVWGYAGGPDVLGPPRWWAPERARGRRASGDADQWAVGAILAALVTGRVPWRGDDPAADARIGDAAHLWQPVMDQWKPLGRLIERALAAEPRDRFPSVHPIRQALDAMRQRVPQASDLTAMGQALVARYGDGLRPPALLDDEPPLDDDDLGRPTTVSELPPPLDAPDPYVRASLLPRVEFEPPTDVGTSPTRIPLPDSFVDRDSVIDEPAEPTPPRATAVDHAPEAPLFDELDAYTVPPSAVEALDLADAVDALERPSRGDEPPSMGDVEVAVRPRPARPPVPAPAPDGPVWYERVDIARVAPVVVGSFGLLLVAWLVWQVV